MESCLLQKWGRRSIVELLDRLSCVQFVWCIDIPASSQIDCWDTFPQVCHDNCLLSAIDICTSSITIQSQIDHLTNYLFRPGNMIRPGPFVIGVTLHSGVVNWSFFCGVGVPWLDDWFKIRLRVLGVCGGSALGLLFTLFKKAIFAAYIYVYNVFRLRQQFLHRNSNCQQFA